MDRLRGYEIFVKAAEAGSFARAAAMLRIDPSAVSHAVRQLERKLDVVLFYRTTRQLRLTADGEELCAHARRLLQNATELEAAVRGRKLSGQLRVGMHVPISRNIVMPRLAGFLRRYPALAVECLVLAQVKDMHASGVDLLVGPAMPPGTDIVAHELLALRFGVYAAPAYLARAGVPETPADLVRHECLVHWPPTAPQPLDEWQFVRNGSGGVVRIPRRLVTDDREGLIDAVLQGSGVMRIGMFDPELILSGRLRRVLPEWEWPGAPSMYAFYRAAARRTPKIVAFLRFVEEAFAAFDPEGLTVSHSRAPGAR